ncbi:hypothetical protein NYO98_09515 [Nocardioides sp. STR2]|uniref:Uncharacterized protein n=1 Tax=Nocardioides pini TaxID=2975053 RepID=A0ABT4CC28_9ACTN|nr:hypothetical protein [Nocardioides pini]MCY4726516.1 hypothetical protein [Nocardioides pini]
MDEPQHPLEAREVDPALLELPTSPAPSTHGMAHVQDALRATGLESEVAEVLPTRGGHGADRIWDVWTDVTWSDAFRAKPTLDLDVELDRFRWPASLYIPRDADYRDHWMVPPPDRQRYALAWPAPGSTTRPDWASAQTGDLFAYAIVPWTSPADDTRGEAGIGIRYSPAFTLGTVDFEPMVNVRDGMLAAVLDYYPTLSAGHVTLRASVVLASWQVIPGGFDLLDHAVLPVAGITRDQSFGPERARLPGSLFTPRPFRKRFLVQAGREYLFGVVGRVEAMSTLTDPQGRPLTGTDGSNFKVYTWITLGIPYMTVDTVQVHIP